MLTLYGRATSVKVQKVLWCLVELGGEALTLGDIPAGTTLFRYFASLTEAALPAPALPALAAPHQRLTRARLTGPR